MPPVQAFRILLSPGNGRYDVLSVQQELYRTYGPVVRQHGGIMSYVNLLGPEANRMVLSNRRGAFSAEIPWNMIMGKIFTNGLLLRDGADHRHHRVIMQEAFKPGVLRQYASRMNPMIDEGVRNWKNALDRKMFHSYKELTLNVAATIFMGERLGKETAAVNRSFEDMVAAAMSLLRLPFPWLEYGRGLKGRKHFVRFLQKRIAEKRAGDGADMFSRLCHAESAEGGRFTDQEVIDHMVFLMMAAHDTTTSTLTSLTYLLAKHPDWQERLRDESRGLDKAHPDFDDLDSLASLTLAMRETLRLYPPLPLIPRVATEDCEIGGYQIPAKTLVQVSPIFTHRMREWWTEPDRFDPERFAPDRAEHEQHTHLWIPFGAGAHICLGMRFAETQIRLIMHQMLLRYRWSVPEGYVMPVQQAPISKPVDGLPVSLEAIG